MHDRLRNTYVKLRALMSGEQVQDSVKHELLRAFIARVMISSGDIVATVYRDGDVAFIHGVSTTLA